MNTRLFGSSFGCSFRLSRCLFASLCGYKREVAPLYEHIAHSHHCLQSFALPHSLPHPVLRHAPRAGTVGLRNPVSCDPVRERGDKVFRERSARLLKVSSSRTPTRTMSSPTRTSSPTLTTSSVTCLSPMTTPTAVLHPHWLQHRMSS
jgi:hypothetical protein